MAQATLTHDDREVLDNHRSLPMRSLVIAGLSTVIEWYDFTLYLYLAKVISRVFYGGGDAGIAATFLGFAVAYLMRPFGAAFFGHLGDRHGRRYVLLISMAMMSAAMLITGLLPSQATIGSAAGWLLLIMRCFMAFSVGGEYNGVLTYLVEGARPERRGFVTSLAAAASEVGGLLAVGAAALVAWLMPNQLDSIGWRIPFFFGAALAALILFLRSTMEESPVFDDEGGTSKPKQGSPLLAALRSQPLAILRTFCISALGSITYYVGITYVPTFLDGVGKMPEAVSLALSVIPAIAVIAITPFAGLASDRLGRRPILIGFAVAALLLPLTMFAFMANGTAGKAVVGSVVLAFVAGGVSAVAASANAEQFSTDRMSGQALGVTAATAIFGGLTPLVAEKLVTATHWNMAPGAMIAVVALCVLPVLWFLPETAPAKRK